MVDGAAKRASAHARSRIIRRPRALALSAIAIILRENCALSSERPCAWANQMTAASMGCMVGDCYRLVYVDSMAMRASG